MELPRTGHGISLTDRGPPRPRERPLRIKKTHGSDARPTGRLTPAPAVLASGSLERAALEYRARCGESLVLYADETMRGRFALPRAGWWCTVQRARLPTRPLRSSQIKRDESLKRHASLRDCCWDWITSHVLLSVIRVVQYGTAKVF
jgi:hypothetical protein